MDKEFFESVDDCIDELLVRFIINAPKSELVFDDNYRPMLLFEKAYYFYKDNIDNHGNQLTVGFMIKKCKKKNEREREKDNNLIFFAILCSPP